MGIPKHSTEHLSCLPYKNCSTGAPSGKWMGASLKIIPVNKEKQNYSVRTTPLCSPCWVTDPSRSHDRGVRSTHYVLPEEEHHFAKTEPKSGHVLLCSCQCAGNTRDRNSLNCRLKSLRWSGPDCLTLQTPTLPSRPGLQAPVPQTSEGAPGQWCSSLCCWTPPTWYHRTWAPLSLLEHFFESQF